MNNYRTLIATFALLLFWPVAPLLAQHGEELMLKNGSPTGFGITVRGSHEVTNYLLPTDRAGKLAMDDLVLEYLVTHRDHSRYLRLGLASLARLKGDWTGLEKTMAEVETLWSRPEYSSFSEESLPFGLLKMIAAERMSTPVALAIVTGMLRNSPSEKVRQAAVAGINGILAARLGQGAEPLRDLALQKTDVLKVAQKTDLPGAVVEEAWQAVSEFHREGEDSFDAIKEALVKSGKNGERLFGKPTFDATKEGKVREILKDGIRTITHEGKAKW